MSTINTSSVSGIAVSVVNVGTRAEANKANSPKGVLQYIVNFFTFGYLRKNNEKQYQEFVNAMANALEKNRRETQGDREGFSQSNEMSFDIHNCTVKFTVTNSGDNTVMLEVKSNESEEVERVAIGRDNYKKICDALQLRTQCNIPQSAAILTENGGLDLFQADLTKANLRNVDLRNADMRRANISKCTLFGVDLRSANLDGADLSGASLYKVKLCEANLSNAKMRSVHISNVELDKAVIYNSDMKNCSLNDTTLCDANISRSAITHAHVTNVDMRGIKAEYSNFSGSIFRNVDFSKANLAYSSFSKIIKNSHTPLGYTISAPADLRECNFTEAMLRNSQLSGLDVEQTNFTDATFHHVFLNNTDMSSANTENLLIEQEPQSLIVPTRLSAMMGTIVNLSVFR
ncbi:MAG: pentapeptide repeat-containing protein [Plesiomonas sp.]